MIVILTITDTWHRPGQTTLYLLVCPQCHGATSWTALSEQEVRDGVPCPKCNRRGNK